MWFNDRYRRWRVEFCLADCVYCPQGCSLTYCRKLIIPRQTSTPTIIITTNLMTLSSNYLVVYIIICMRINVQVK